MIKPELEFVYEAGGELEPPREIGPAGAFRQSASRAGGVLRKLKPANDLRANHRRDSAPAYYSYKAFGVVRISPSVGRLSAT